MKPFLLLTFLIIFIYSCHKSAITPSGRLDFPRSGLVAFYPFNGDALDYSGNDYHGEVTNAYPIYGRREKLNQSYLFNGEDDAFIEVPHSDRFNLSKLGGISLWINIHSLNESNNNIYWHIIGKGAKASWDTDGYCLFYHNGLNVILGVLTNKSAKPHINRVNFGTLEIAKWYHLVFTWDGSFMKGYINGNLIGEPIEQTHNIPVISDPLIIGKKPFGRRPGFFHGQIDQVRIYDRALTDNEVMLLYKE